MTDKPASRKVAIKPASGQRRQVDYASELNPEQLAVVMHVGEPMLVLAGAGSGKTRTVVYRVARLLEDGVEPGAVMLLTFTNRASREMLSRVGTLLGRDAGRVMGGTFHSVGNRLPRRRSQRYRRPSYRWLSSIGGQDKSSTAACSWTTSYIWAAHSRHITTSPNRAIVRCSRVSAPRPLR